MTLAPTTVLFGGNVSAFPTVRVKSVTWTDPNGDQFTVDVPEAPTGGFTPADVTINSIVDALIELEAMNVPEGTPVTVEVHSESLGTQAYVSSGLTGTDALRTASVTATIDPGFNSVTVRATFP